MPMPDPDTTVTTSERLWGEEVANAEACCPVPRTPWVYEFGGDRRFFEPEDPYAPRP